MTARTEDTANALRRPLSAGVEVPSGAAPAVVYDRLADLRSHTAWTGLASIEAPPGPAVAGTEFTSTGPDPMGSFADRSVVTEAVRGKVFEHVTEARLTPKRGGEPVDWTLVHRYELRPDGTGARITYTVTITHLSATPGLLRLLRGRFAPLVMKMSAAGARRALRRLAATAEERSGH